MFQTEWLAEELLFVSFWDVCAGVNTEIEVLRIGSRGLQTAGAGRSRNAADSIWWNLGVWDIQRFHAHKHWYDMLSGRWFRSRPLHLLTCESAVIQKDTLIKCVERTSLWFAVDTFLCYSFWVWMCFISERLDKNTHDTETISMFLIWQQLR